MSTLSELVEMESADAETIAQILPDRARLSFSTQGPELLSLFARAAGVLPQKEVIAGTGFVFLEAVAATTDTAAFIRVTASNGNQTVSVISGNVQVHMPGASLVPGRRVHDILKLIPVPNAKIDVIGDAMQLRSGRALWTIAVPPGDAAPFDLNIGRIKTEPVPAAALLHALAAVRPAVSPTSARVALTQVEIRNGSVTACDGGRFHRVRVPGLSREISTALPAAAVDELLVALKNTDDEFVLLGYDETRVLVRVGRDVIVAQRLVVDFPDVESLVLGPTFTNDKTLTVITEYLAEAVKRVRVNSDPNSAIITLNIIPGVGAEPSWVLVVQARDPLGNTSKEAMTCRWTGTAPHSVHLNHRYLSDMLAVIQGKGVHIKLGPDTRTVKSPLYVKEDDFIGVIQQILW